MKTTVSVQQLIVIIAIVVVLVFIATYASILTGSGQVSNGPDKTVTAPGLQFPLKTPRPEDLSPPGFMESEIHQGAHYDFWFQNTKDQPLSLKLQRVGCSKCTTVQTVLLPDVAELLPKPQLDERAKAGLQWQDLSHEGKGVQVPAKAVGGVRLNWKGETLGPNTITAILVAEHPNRGEETIDLAVNVLVVEAMRVVAEDYGKPEAGRLENEAPLGLLLAGETRSAKFLCWSSSRKDFQVNAIPTGDPCVTCSQPVKLSEEECKEFGKKGGTRFLAGYRFTVTVAETSKEGRQLDLGGFRRRVSLENDDAKVEVIVSGTVKGVISIGTGPDKEFFNLGNFQASQGESGTLNLVAADQPNVELEIATPSDLADRKEKTLPFPEFMPTPKLEKVKDADGSGKVWNLTVTVPPNSWSGPIPRESAVYVKVKGEKPRFIRVPIVGNAYVR